MIAMILEYFDMPMTDAKFGYWTEYLLILPYLEGLVARLSMQMPTFLPIAACKDLQWALGQFNLEVLPSVPRQQLFYQCSILIYTPSRGMESLCIRACSSKNPYLTLL